MTTTKMQTKQTIRIMTKRMILKDPAPPVLQVQGHLGHLDPETVTLGPGPGNWAEGYSCITERPHHFFLIFFFFKEYGIFDRGKEQH